MGAGERGPTLRRDLRRRAPPAGAYDLVFLDPPFVLWDGAEGRALLDRAAPLLAPDGRLVLKLPARAELVGGDAWHVERRKTFGEVAWALLAPGPMPTADPAPRAEG